MDLNNSQSVCGAPVGLQDPSLSAGLVQTVQRISVEYKSDIPAFPTIFLGETQVQVQKQTKMKVNDNDSPKLGGGAPTASKLWRQVAPTGPPPPDSRVPALALWAGQRKLVGTGALPTLLRPPSAH